MSGENPNHDKPKKTDVVLGGQNPLPEGAAVLGGIAGVKQRLRSPRPEVRIATLADCLKYGQAGWEVITNALLNDESSEVQAAVKKIIREENYLEIMRNTISKENVTQKTIDRIFKILFDHINDGLFDKYHFPESQNKEELFQVVDLEMQEIDFLMKKIDELSQNSTYRRNKFSDNSEIYYLVKKEYLLQSILNKWNEDMTFFEIIFHKVHPEGNLDQIAPGEKMLTIKLNKRVDPERHDYCSFALYKPYSPLESDYHTINYKTANQFQPGNNEGKWRERIVCDNPNFLQRSRLWLEIILAYFSV